MPEALKQERRERFMLAASRISRDKLRRKVGRKIQVLVDEVRPDGVAVARSKADAPEIDGAVFVKGLTGVKAGDFADVRVTRTEAYDLWAEPADRALRSAPLLAPRPGMRRVISRV